MGGFTYNGIHSSQFNVEYVPNAEARWWAGADYEIYSKKVSWKNGGYIYGSAANIRKIKMDCYFEEISIAMREKIRKWLGRTTKGKLIFDELPFVYYNVVVSEVVPGKLYLDTGETYSGTFSVTFMAADPFGYLTRKSSEGNENDHAEDYCNLITSARMPPEPDVSSRSFDVYNPGTEPCGMQIMIAGTCESPIRFFNSRNKTECVISSLPDNSLTLDINENDTGMVKVYVGTNSGNYDNGFAYHDHGVIRLEPSELFENVSYTATQNGTMYTITPSGITVTEDMVGGHIWFMNPITREATITDVNTSTGKLTCVLTGSGTFRTSGTMRLYKSNHITIEEKNSNNVWVTPTHLTLSRIAIDYKPRLL